MENKEIINILELIKGLAEREKNAVLILKDLEAIMNNSTEEEISRNLGRLSLMELLHIRSNIENTKAAFSRAEKALRPLLSSMLSFGLGALSTAVNDSKTIKEIVIYIVGILIIVGSFLLYTTYFLFQKIDYHDNNVDVMLSLTNLVIDNKKEVLEKYLSNDDIKEVVDRTVKENNLEKKDENNRGRDNKNKKKKNKKKKNKKHQ